MRYQNGCIVSVPFIDLNADGETDRAWAGMRFEGNVDRRRVKREIVKWIKRNIGRQVHPNELYLLMKKVQPL